MCMHGGTHTHTHTHTHACVCVCAQAAVGNWELLGAMALLWPKVLALRRVQEAVETERGDPETDEMRRDRLQAYLPRVEALSEQRHLQRQWCGQVCGRHGGRRRM